MEKPKDIRWKQRFTNFEKALINLRDFINAGELNVREQQGLIKSFEYTFELGWNVMHDLRFERFYKAGF